MSFKHGMIYTKTYNSWCAMLTRCRGTCTPWKRKFYSDKGITVCDRWLEFLNFHEDMGDRPEGMTLDRIDSSGSYCKENCRWATKIQQARNTSFNHMLTYNGITQCVAAWSEELGLERGAIPRRIKKGWPIEKVLRDKSDRSHIRKPPA